MVEESAAGGGVGPPADCGAGLRGVASQALKSQ